MLYFVFIILPIFVTAEWTWSQELFKISETLTETTKRAKYDDEIRCHSCTTMNASEIMGGSGAHPGVYLTSLLLSSIPVTSVCENPIEQDGLAPICDQGVCVKINYTARHSGRTDVLRTCIPRSEGVFKQLCTRFASNQAYGTWCVCGEDLCNTAATTTKTTIFSFLYSTFLTLAFIFLAHNC